MMRCPTCRRYLPTCICRRPIVTSPLPEQWNCVHCNYGEYKNRDDWATRKAEHERLCPSNPNGPGHPLHGIIRGRR